MFGSGNKKEKLEKKYAALLEQSHKLSTSNRKASDLKMQEADKVLAEIQKLEAANA